MVGAMSEFGEYTSSVYMRRSEVERDNWHVHLSAAGPLTRVLFETLTTAKLRVSSRVVFVGKVSEGAICDKRTYTFIIIIYSETNNVG